MHLLKYFTAAVAGAATMSGVVASPSPAPLDLSSLEAIEALLARDKVALVSRQNLGDALGGLTDLLASLRRFLSPDFLDDTHSVVTGLAGLLAPPFVNQTRGLINEAGGLLEGIGPLLDGVGPLLEGIGPLLEEIGPLLSQIGELDLGGLVSAVSGLLTPETIKTIGDLLNNASRLLTREFVDQISQLIADVAPLVSAVAQFVTALITALLGGGQ
ncbi:hypothetical protein B0T11DRAFT_349941 [Plectosphaerella cucumerina]|uniref:Uncharacterized protein n=1 Tax=Plectosphaerella cucumerina TaxID=40658 RepID=A0A8K0X618_9PEZI|nr:hypothetical protein B0T11DRAFT_349941 [Plectosphaerella cucumerina]